MRAVHGGSLDLSKQAREPIRWGRSRQAALRSDRTGEWGYLYRAIDRDGTLVDVYLSETRDMAAAKTFLRSAKSVTQVEPEQVTTDGHTSYPKAIADELGTDVDHRTSQYKNNVIEQDHRGI